MMYRPHCADPMPTLMTASLRLRTHWLVSDTKLVGLRSQPWEFDQTGGIAIAILRVWPNWWDCDHTPKKTSPRIFFQPLCRSRGLHTIDGVNFSLDAVRILGITNESGKEVKRLWQT